MNILLTGATGFIGQELGIQLVQSGHQITVVSRNAESAINKLPFPCEVIECDLVNNKIQPNLLKEIQIVIHLAGENIGDSRWTSEQKQKILDSRILSTHNLYSSFPNNHKIETIIQSSAIGYYGNKGDELLDENSNSGSGFLSHVCQQWEQTARQSIQQIKNNSHIRTIYLRTGVVLSEYGGALEKMILPFKNNIGSAVGSGNQFLSWVHIIDLVSIFNWLIENKNISGIVNAVSPDPVTNLELSKKLAKLFNTFLLPAVPTFAIRMALGEMSELVLSSQKVSPNVLIKNNFKFKFDTIETALESVCQSAVKNEIVFQTKQYLPFTKKTVFSFFSKAENLESITPPLLCFKIKSMSTPVIQKNTEITYQLKIHNIPVEWVTNIEDWEPEHRFIDNQIKGPYRKWHHTHEFFDLSNGTLMVDTIRYKLPLGQWGALAAGWLVKNDVQNIFNYRRSSVLKFIKE